MDKEKISKLIEKYVNNECLPGEKIQLEKYLESFQGKDRSWVESEMGNKDFLEEKIYSAITKNIHKERISIFHKIYHSPYLIKIAAAIVLFILIASGVFYISNILNKRSNALVWNEKVTGIGEKSIVAFSDGTKITLNSNSKLKYPNKFGEEAREVYLTGEAFFEVARDSIKPFTAYSGSLSITVLGTAFNINAFPDGKEITVSLVEGKIKVSKKDTEEKKDILMLKPEQQLVYSKEEDISRVQSFDLLEVIGWKDSILKVTDEPLEKVFTKLTVFFGIKFELRNKKFLKVKITANFRNDSFKIGAEILKKLTGLKYKIISENNQHKKIIFY